VSLDSSLASFFSFGSFSFGGQSSGLHPVFGHDLVKALDESFSVFA